MDKSVARFNLLKGLISNSLEPQKFMNYLGQMPEMLNYYKYNTYLQNSNWFFYILNNIEHTKKWYKLMLHFAPQDFWLEINEKGNNLFLESLEKKHLKVALLLAKQGLDINHRNNNNNSFVEIIYNNLSEEMSKKQWYSYLLFLNKIIENNYPIALNPDYYNSLLKIFNLSSEIFENNKKASIYGYEDYWNDIIAFNQSLREKVEQSKSLFQRRILEENLKVGIRKKIIKKI